MDLFLRNMQLLASQDINWWTGVVWITCDVFISCLDSHSDGNHSLQRIHWWASDGMLHFSKSDEKNKVIYILDVLSTFSANFHFWLNYSFKTVFQPGQAGASGLTADISQNPFKTSKTVQLVKISSHKGLLMCFSVLRASGESERRTSAAVNALLRDRACSELTLAFCSVSSEATRSSTSSLRLCFSFSSLALVLCRLSHCSPSSDRASLWRFLSAAATASACTDDSSSSLRRRCSSSSRFLFISIYTHRKVPLHVLHYRSKVWGQ